MKVLAIRTKYRHHSEYAGYDNICTYISDCIIEGINEKGNIPNKLYLKYKWLYEFKSYYNYHKNIDLVHILYGEEYFRFSTYLFKQPIICTFHQPAEILERELRYGDTAGRLYKYTHQITKRRFQDLDAAIVLEESQKKVLSKFVPIEKIHVIPHGIDAQSLINKNANRLIDSKKILTVGNWLRDWDFYYQLLSKFEQIDPSVKFVLVNRNIDKAILDRLLNKLNFIYAENISDESLIELIQTSSLLFMPLKGAAANNALLECISLGCPVLMPDIVNYPHAYSEIIRYYEFDSIESAIIQIQYFINMQFIDRSRLKEIAQKISLSFSWENIAKKTIEVYHKVLMKND